MSEHIKLTIGIVTYNQPEGLRRALDSIMPQLTSGVEIVIRDDSPDERSAKIVEAYAKEGVIRYFHGEKIGIDAADYFVVEHAKGEYVWWWGDDEMAPGGIAHVMELLNKHADLDFIWVNNKSKEYGQIGLDWGESRFFKNGDEAIAEVADLLGFLSALVFRRDLGWASKKPAERFIGTNFGGLYLVFYVLAHGRRFYYLAEPYIIAKTKHPEDQYFFDAFQVFGVTYYEMLKDFEGVLGHDAIKRSLTKNFNQVWRGILVYRAKGLTTNFGSRSRKLPTMFRLYWTFPDFWKALPFLLMPRWLLRICYNVYKKIRPGTWDRFKEKYN